MANTKVLWSLRVAPASRLCVAAHAGWRVQHATCARSGLL